MTMNLRAVRVTETAWVTQYVRRFTLRAVDGGRLPAWSAGSHIALAFSHGGNTWQNSYSLIGDPGETEFYRIAVRRADSSQSKGGSLHLHERVKVGDTMEIGPPVNYFPIVRHAKKHLLIAGGIGITPFLAQMATLKKSALPYELHYAFRSRREGAFCDVICEEHGQRAHYYVSEEGRRLSPASVLSGQPLGTHAYVCGPHSLIAAVAAAAADLGWPSTHIHYEEFAPPAVSGATPFHVHLPNLGLEIKVGTHETLLEALENAGVQIASSCRVGMCGTCEMRVLEGDPEHRDRCLSEGEMQDGRIIACVSRCRGDRLSLALPDAASV